MGGDGATRAAAWRGAAPLAAVLLAWAAAWLVLFAAVPPSRQNFPLDDDWAFARGAIGFSRGEGVHYYGWASMPQLGQWLWAWPFLRALGESHAVLRLSTLVLALLGIVAFYDLLRREAGASPGCAAFAAAVLAFNPVWFLLAGTFMTDVPALSLSLLALAAYARGLRGGWFAWLLAATVAALLAVLTRQNAVAAPLAAAVACWRLPAGGRRWSLAVIVLPVVAGAAIHVWFNRRADVIPGQPFRPSPDRFLYLLVFGGQLLGLSTIPLLLFRSVPGKRLPFAVALAALLCGAGLLALIARPLSGGWFPYAGNVLAPAGALASEELVPGVRPPLLGRAGQMTLTLVGCLAGARLVQLLVARMTIRPRTDLLLLFALCNVPLLLLAPVVFDRYLLFLLPAALAWVVAAGTGRVRLVAGLAGLALYGLLATALMHDWLAWNAARWELGRRAVARGMSPEEIEGGFEWDGWHAPAGAAHGAAGAGQGFVLPKSARYFPDVTGRFALSFTPLPGGEVLDTETYYLWLPPGERRFLLVGLGNPGERGASAPR